MRTILVTSPEELDDHTYQWESLRRRTEGNIYNGIHLTKIWQETFYPSSKPSVILIEDGGELVGVAPLALSTFKIKCLSLKTASLVGWLPHTLGLPTNSIMYLPERKDVLKQIIQEIKHLDWSILRTQNMDDSPAVQRYISEASSTWRSEVQTPNVNLTIPVKETGDILDGFSSHAQKNVRKAMRKVEREGHTAEFRKVPLDGIDKAVNIYAKQHIDRWQTRGGSYFDDPRNCQFLNRASRITYERGSSFIYEYLIDGDVVSQLVGFHEREKAFFYRVGMNNLYMNLSPGYIIHYLAMTDLREKGARQFIVGGGEESHKYELGGERSLLVGFQSTRGVVSLMNSIYMSKPVQSLSERFGIKDRMIASLSVNGTDKKNAQ